MIGTSTFDFYLIRTCIIGLHYLAPLCTLYCIIVVALYGIGATRYPVPLVVELTAVAETLFYLLTRLHYQAYLQRKASHPPILSNTERRELFDLCNENILDPEAYLSKWFLGAPLEEIKRENLKDFFLWAFFNRSGPPGNDDAELEEYVDAVQQLLRRKIESGRGSAQCLRLTLDRVDMLHRSLIWYWCISFVDFLAYLSLLRRGFHFHRTALSRFFTLFPLRPQTLLAIKKSPAKYLTYWHRQHTSKAKLPILFIHGIGIGLYPYATFLSDLNSAEGLGGGGPDDQVGIIAIEIMPVSSRITHPALSKSEICAEIETILDHHGWDNVVLVSHSYGTVVSTHLLKTPSTAQLIDSIVLIDPVSILLHLPDVAYNFTRRKPERANEHLIYYFGSMDMGVSHTLSRHFFWFENILWKKDFEGRNITVSLAGRDLIVNSEAVRRYLTSGSLSCNTSTASSTTLIALEATHNDQGGPTTDQTNKAVVKVDEATDEAAKEAAATWNDGAWKGKGLDIIWFDSLDHAQVFDSHVTRRPLVRAIRAYCAQGMPYS